MRMQISRFAETAAIGRHWASLIFFSIPSSSKSLRLRVLIFRPLHLFLTEGVALSNCSPPAFSLDSRSFQYLQPLDKDRPCCVKLNSVPQIHGGPVPGMYSVGSLSDNIFNPCLGPRDHCLWLAAQL